MARRLSNFRVQPLRQGQRRQTIWVASADSTGTTALPANATVLDQSFDPETFGLGPVTIVRTRGLLTVQSDQVAASEFPFGAMGFGVAEAAAVAAGIASLPTPITEEDWDGWFVYESFAAPLLLATAVGMLRAEQFAFGSKAQRKVVPGSVIFINLESASSTAGLLYTLKFRMLLKTH